MYAILDEKHQICIHISYVFPSPALIEYTVEYCSYKKEHTIGDRSEFPPPLATKSLYLQVRWMTMKQLWTQSINMICFVQSLTREWHPIANVNGWNTECFCNWSRQTQHDSTLIMAQPWGVLAHTGGTCSDLNLQKPSQPTCTTLQQETQDLVSSAWAPHWSIMVADFCFSTQNQFRLALEVLWHWHHIM